MSMTSHKPVQHMSSAGKFLISRIFPAIFIIVGIYSVFFGVRDIIRANASTNWPTSTGEVLSSSVELQRDSSEGTYHPKITYNFKVDNISFEGSRVAYGEYGSNTRIDARNIASRYPRGMQVMVHYMPGHPEENLLETGIKPRALLQPIFGLLFFLVGSFFAFKLPRAIRAQERREDELEDIAINSEFL